jgi:CelD/BcsL family acetyltransferase involved in cellulose biosynthesis
VTRATSLTAFRNASAAVDLGQAAFSHWTDSARDSVPELSFRIHTDLASIEGEWRAFEQTADATPFQSFDWLSTWQRRVGTLDGTVPAVAIGRFGDGRTAFIFPLAVEPRRLMRRLCWLGQNLCDYNAPLLAREFFNRVTPDGFRTLWGELLKEIRSDPRLRHDWIEFEKMPQTVGAQTNPFTFLGVTPNANSAHITRLGGEWQSFYRAKRSSATRRRDRAKRKHMAEFGEIGFLTASDVNDIRQTLETLWEQKKLIFARKGIADIFERPGYREFFLDFATNPRSRQLAHISRVEIGSTCAAANFAIVFGDCYYHVLSSYCDGQLAHYGPGALHLRDLMAYAIGRGLQRFDFTIGDEHYKSEWCDVRLELFDYSAATTWRGFPASVASQMRRRVKRAIKQTPAAWRLVSKLRSSYGALTQPRLP